MNGIRKKLTATVTLVSTLHQGHPNTDQKVQAFSQFFFRVKNIFGFFDVYSFADVGFDFLFKGEKQFHQKAKSTFFPF